MKDRVTLGLLVGIVTQAIKLPLDLTFEMTGLVTHTDIHIAAGIFLKEASTQTIAGRVLGSLATLIISAILSVVIVYLLTATGKDYWWAKGFVVGGAAWVGLWGILMVPDISTAVPTDVVSSMTALILYLLWGVFAAYLALRWGDDELFVGVKNLS